MVVRVTPAGVGGNSALEGEGVSGDITTADASCDVHLSGV